MDSAATAALLPKEAEGSSTSALLEAYDKYLESYLPQKGQHRPYAGKRNTKDYMIGFYNFTKNMEHLSLAEGQTMGIYMDMELATGAVPFVGRREAAEKSATLASCGLVKDGKSSKSQNCRFELLQKDVMGICHDYQHGTACFLLMCTINSKKGRLTAARVHFGIEGSAESCFLAVGKPPVGAEYVAPLEVNGAIEFVRSTPEKGKLYAGYPTCGVMGCDWLDSSRAVVNLVPPEGAQEVSCLSGLVLVCLPVSEELDFDVSVSVEAFLSAGDCLKKWSKDKSVSYKLENKVVQLSA